ncbi:phosphatidylinositol glycan anchor biosynthesis class T isoform X2 [Lycorma delicatula]|uniref:phosphatidylinositol glycan anchor biosynthesis class T isoform X2 n=1 Tax=Lycorma delicatula TaxID=130591 RepID=UPI003F51929E
MKLCYYLSLILAICVKIVFCVIQEDSFYEELLLKPLPSDHVYSYFQFTTLWDSNFSVNNFDHCHLFPRSLGEVVGRFNLQELHISLTEGLWRHESWGYPVTDAPPGAEVWAWFKKGTADINKNWKELTAALSGLLCASLNFIDASNSISPEISFRLTGVDDLQNPLNSSHLRYAALPREVVCTENLTPWKKLLPCDSKKGLATLLNAGYIHNTNYHSLGIHLREICKPNTDCSQTSIELKQTVSLVYDLVILEGATHDWSVRKLFGIGIAGPCPLAKTSSIYVDVTLNQTGSVFHLSPIPEKKILSSRGGHTSQFAVYDIKEIGEKIFNIAASYDKTRIYNLNVPPVIFANRYIVVVKKFVPGKERIRPYYLEVVVELQQRSVTEISIEFDYMFLKWQEYPPDANHGFYVGSAIVTAMLPVARNYTGLPQDGSLFSSSFNASRPGYFIQLRTESLIINLPTPDFSMPYNVICLACTVVALAFGPIHNITTKKLHMMKVDNEKGIGGHFKWFRSAINKLKGNNKTAETDENKHSVTTDKKNK